MDVVMPSFWSCFTWVGLDLDAAAYRDEVGTTYAYDSNVVNHRGIAVGDVLVIRDRHLVYGHGVVETVSARPGTKPMNRCPQCGTSAVSRRKRVVPAYRCNRCHAEFDQPAEDVVDVTKYVATYGALWFEMPSPIPVRALDRVYQGKDRQNAIRRLNPAAAVALLTEHASVEGTLHLEFLGRTEPILGGHVDAVVRARIGQGAFRAGLIERFGTTCAVTGRQPEEVLDAAHLYSFAQRPEHHLDGGLLLRADLHRLFDRLLLTFDPATWRTRVAPQLIERYPAMQSYDRVPITIGERARPATPLIEDHFRASHGRWRDLSRAAS